MKNNKLYALLEVVPCDTTFEVDILKGVFSEEGKHAEEIRILSETIQGYKERLQKKEVAIVHVTDAIEKLSFGECITQENKGMYEACRDFHGISRSEQGYPATTYRGRGYATVKDCWEEISSLQSLITKLEKYGFSNLDYKWVEVEVDHPLII